MKLPMSEIEHLEKTQLRQIKKRYWPGEVRTVDTEPNIRGRIKVMFRAYCEQRSHGVFNRGLLIKIQHQFFLYRVRRPLFFTRSILCFEDLNEAVAALPLPKRARVVGDSAPPCGNSPAQFSGSDAAENGECPFEVP